MKRFADLIYRVSDTTGTLEKLEALSTYLAEAEDADKLWMVALFTGRRPRRTVTTTRLRTWAATAAGLPDWLFEESYHSVGDLAETIALVLPPADKRHQRTLTDWMQFLASLRQADEDACRTAILDAWSGLTDRERFVFNKLITGGFRIGVSRQLVIQALARVMDLPPAVVAHRISGNWTPADTSFRRLLSGEDLDTDASKPYPFCLAKSLDLPLPDLGDPGQWQAEWKWDGIRGQLVCRRGQLFVWSRGEELLTDKFPEFHPLARLLPAGTVLDGEILPWQDGKPLPFQALQPRITRKTVTRRQLAEAPLVFLAYDLLESGSRDCRDRPLADRREELAGLVAATAHPALRLSPVLPFGNWQELAPYRDNAREVGAEGLMIKALSSTYHTGRKSGDWWKWKVDPLRLDVVLVAAQKGHGRRADLYTDYTLAVRSGDQLVTLTKAYSGLTDREFREVDGFVKSNVLEKFGPVRTVRPELVFEIGFEGLSASRRHKSGVALRFPRILRWRKDKTAADIDTLADVLDLLKAVSR